MGEQAQVVFDRLQRVAVFLAIGPTGMPEHLTNGFVFVGQFMHPVVVGIEPQPDHPQYQDLPLRHAGAPGLGIGLAVDPDGEDLFQNGAHPGAQIRSGVDVLQPAQQLRDVVAGLGVEEDGTDVLLAELQLGVDDLTHGVSNGDVYWS